MIETVTYPLRFLIWQPANVAIVGVLFLLLGEWSRRTYVRFCWPTLVAALAWFAFAGWEALAARERWDIRIDYFFLLPCMLSITLYGLIRGFRRPKA